jgi:outer membrane protein OmpA-like peptidoglycan-associated protein
MRTANAPPPEPRAAVRADRCSRARAHIALPALAAAVTLALGGCSWLRPHAAAAPAASAAPVKPDFAPPTSAEDPAGADSPAANAPLQRNKSPEKLAARRSPPGSAHEMLAASDVGYYMDVLQGRLTQLLGSEARIERRGEDIVVTIAYATGFELGKAKLSSAGRAQLKPLAATLTTFHSTLLSIRVRGEEPDSAVTGGVLGTQRTAAVARCLSEGGIAGRRIVTGGGALNRLPVADLVPGSVRLELGLTPITAASASTL